MYRPTGVALLAVVAAALGGYVLIGSLALLTVGGTAVGGWQGAVFAAGIVALIYAAISFVIAYGLWDLRPWTWPLALVLQGLGIVLLALRWAAGISGPAEAVVGLALTAGVTWYLLRPDVREALRRGLPTL
jgi:hypothetical protein